LLAIVLNQQNCVHVYVHPRLRLRPTRALGVLPTSGTLFDLADPPIACDAEPPKNLIFGPAVGQTMRFIVGFNRFVSEFGYLLP
jgi:hypothetical protein